MSCQCFPTRVFLRPHSQLCTFFPRARHRSFPKRPEFLRTVLVGTLKSPRWSESLKKRVSAKSAALRLAYTTCERASATTSGRKGTQESMTSRSLARITSLPGQANSFNKLTTTFAFAMGSDSRASPSCRSFSGEPIFTTGGKTLEVCHFWPTSNTEETNALLLLPGWCEGSSKSFASG